jgi:hypothetical protein
MSPEFMKVFDLTYSLVYTLCTFLVLFVFDKPKKRAARKKSYHHFVMATYFMFGVYFFYAMDPMTWYWAFFGWWDVGLGIVYFIFGFMYLLDEMGIDHTYQ